MNIIFLDIDGVLNSFDYFKSLELNKIEIISGYNDIDENSLPILKQIVEDNNAQIVLSSTWRNLEDLQDQKSQKMYQYLINMLDKYGMKIMSKTPIINFRRPLEIKTWLDNRSDTNKINWISIEDDFFEEDYEMCGLGGHLIHTRYFDIDGDESSGLQKEHIKFAKELFKKQMEE